MKTKALLLPVFLLLAAVAASVSYESTNQQADAAYETKQIFSDKFENSEIEDEWTKVNSVSLKQHYSSLRFSPSEYDWGATLNYHEPLEGNYKITFELLTSSANNWFAIGVGNNHYNSGFANALGGFVFCDGGSLRLTAETGKLDAVDSYPVSPFDFTLNVRRTVVVEVKAINKLQSTLQCYVYEKNTLIGTIFNTPMVYDCLDGYFGFNSCLKQVEIFNLTIHQNDKLIYEDDFSTSEILYSTGGSFDSEWVANTFGVKDVKIGFINSLYTEDINSGVVYSSPLKTPENKEFDITYIIDSQIQYSPMDFHTISGIEIAKNSPDLRGFFFGIEKKIVGYALSIYGPDGQEIHSVETTKENPNLIVNCHLEIYLNGDIAFSTDELSYTVHIDGFEGYIGLMTYSDKTNIEHGKGAYFKSFNLYKNDYYKRDSKDIYLNFNGIKKTYLEEYDEYIYDYWIPKSEYDIGMNVALSKVNKKDGGDGKLEFNSATSASFFGPRDVYKDFIVKFDVQINSVEVPYAGCLGLKFGNSRNGAYIENSQSIGIGYYYNEKGEMKTNPYITNVDYADGANTMFVDDYGNQVDIFKDQNKFTLMFISQNNTVSLHYLLEGEDEINLSKVRTKVVCRENESTDGHLSIYGAMGISFSIDNLSIINLDKDVSSAPYLGTSDYQEVTRLDFTKDEEISGLDLNSASLNSKKLVVNSNGTISTKKLVTDGILRFKVSNLENELDIEQDQLKIKLFNGSKPYLTVTDNSITQKYEFKTGFKFAGSVFEIEKLNNHLIIHYVSGNEPLSKIEQNSIEFIVSTENAPTKLKMTSIGGSLELDSFTFINLNKYSSFVNRDYNEETDYFEPWPVRDPIQGSSGMGCGGSITAGSFVIMIISLLSLSILLLIRRAKR